jgi:hypothetical protein
MPFNEVTRKLTLLNGIPDFFYKISLTETYYKTDLRRVGTSTSKLAQ